MIVLGIESSCDDTGIALVQEGKKTLAHALFSQAESHAKTGGVIPNRAAQMHVENVISVLESTFKEADIQLKEIDLIAATYGPGLIGSLLVGLHTAKTLALCLKKPFVGVNHLEAHIYASLMSSLETIAFPALALIVSGGHTALFSVPAFGHYIPIGQTLDDAVGEAFDKVASLLSLPYPGGPHIEALARDGNPDAYPFAGGKSKQYPHCFSLSGLKTKVLYTIRGQNLCRPRTLSLEEKCDIAASFQRAVFCDIVDKIELALERHPCQTLIFGGGVCANQAFRKKMEREFSNFTLHWPAKGLSTDNGIMVAGLGFHRYRQHGADALTLAAQPGLSLKADAHLS